jgi:hypothetical protein
VHIDLDKDLLLLAEITRVETGGGGGGGRPRSDCLCIVLIHLRQCMIVNISSTLAEENLIQTLMIAERSSPPLHFSSQIATELKFRKRLSPISSVTTSFCHKRYGSLYD